MLQTFLNILSIIGIIAVAAFVIIFLSDLFITIIDGTNGIFFKRNKNKNFFEEEKSVKRPVLLNSPKEYQNGQETLQENQSLINNQAAQNKFDNEVDMDEAAREEQLAKQRAEESRKNVVEARTATPTPIITPAPAQTIKVEKEEEPEEDIDKIISEISKQTLVLLEQEKPTVVEVKEDETLKQKQKELEEQIEKLKNQIEEDKSTIANLEEKVKNAPTKTEVKTEIKTIKVVTGNKEDLEKRLEDLKQRLKENEKELSINRKEFVPLRRVNMTLESDKKKLRRREAIVAKQKVVLYGVNNYVDINEEKAKKLSEELDLLEGLRLSVQHCEEVMQKNKDRYPILERANKFLVKNNEDLKTDIKNLEEQIAELEKQENNSDSDDANTNE